MGRKNKTWERKKREIKKGKRTQRGKKKRCFIFLLSVGDKSEILKLIFNTINCFMKHKNLSN